MALQARGLCDLFDLASVQSFISEISNADNITLFAGAGTSIESGFPDWTALVTRVLISATESRLSRDDAEKFASWTIQREGLVGAAAVAEATLADRFTSALHRALYEQQITPPPGQSALSIGALVASFGHAKAEVLTTNYDLVLESAIRASTGDDVTALVRPPKTHASGVLHLHGLITPRNRIRGELVLSERDYFLMQEDSAWQQHYVASRLSLSQCVFVGASLTDPNLLRYLYRSSPSRNHYAVFARQQDADIYDDVGPKVFRLRERATQSRWKDVGVTPLYTDFYSQSAQLLQEITHFRWKKSRRRKYQPLPRRLHRWRQSLEKGILATRGPAFATRQNELQVVMSNLLAGVRRDLVDAGHRPRPHERLGLSMWVYDPRSETLTNWASADRVWRDPQTMQPLPIDWRSDFVSVQAFCAGSIVSRSTERYVASRWNHVIGSPLFVRNEVIGRLPVGAVTIASTEVGEQSALYRGLGTLRRASLPTVEDVLSELLQPEP